ncbi:MAG: response regulator [Armatimonadetes bacterium]|nr:response regulator [Armatimonadota bacterium]
MLIVEDEEEVAKLLAVLLRIEGYQVLGPAANGKEGVFMYGRDKPDLVIMDLMMPEMDGITAMQKIFAMDPGARILVLTARSDMPTVMHALQLGAKSYVLKPFEGDLLYEKIREILAG